MRYILKNARLLPFLCGAGAPAYADIIIDHGVIDRILPAGEAETTGGEAVDCGGRTLLPGLIDAHMHFIMGPLEHETSEFADEYFKLFMAGARKARLLLECGFTTVRDIASSYGVANSIRDAAEEGLIDGPRIISAGHIIGATEERKIVDKDHNVIADGCDECRKAVRREIAHGADIIKIYNSTYPMRKNQGIHPMYTPEEVRTFVSTAHSLGTYVGAHVYGSECVRMCLDAGVYTIEHGGGLDSACIEILAKQQAFLIPTLAPNLLIENSTTYSQVAKDRYFNCLANEENISIRQAYQAGLKLGFGTDIDIVELSENMGCEFLARKKYTGMSNRDMLLQATRNNAQILKIDDLTGSVTEGLSADLILVDGDPEQDISVMTHKPLHVFFRGKRLAVQRV